MKVVTRYETLETRDLNTVERIGLEQLINRFMEDVYGYDLNTHFYYTDGCLCPAVGIPVSEGHIISIGMVHNSIVVEVELRDQETGMPTEDYQIYWFEDRNRGWDLWEIAD